MQVGRGEKVDLVSNEDEDRVRDHRRVRKLLETGENLLSPPAPFLQQE